ncbi:MAG: TonB-dependent siderophore receptor [Opitutales bacterium]
MTRSSSGGIPPSCARERSSPSTTPWRKQERGSQPRGEGRSVWHLDFVRELTVNNANVYSPTATNATPTSLLRRQYNQVINGHRYNYFDANAYHIFAWKNFRNTVLIGAGGGGEFFGNQRISFGPNQTATQAITLINPITGLYAYPADGTGQTAQDTWQTTIGEYISDQAQIGEKIHVSAGLRYDSQKVHGIDTLNPIKTPYFSQGVNAVTKQLGAVYDLTQKLSAYASWSTSVKPSATIAVDSSGNSSFPPETGEQYEAGLKFETPAKNVNIDLAAYRIDRNNVLVASGTNLPSGQAISRLDGLQRSTGYELEVQWQPLPNWQVQAGAAYDKPIIMQSLKNPTTVGLDLANAPRQSGSLYTRYNFPAGGLKGLGVSFGFIDVGRSWAGDPTTKVYYRLDAWTRADAAIFYRWRKYDMALNIQNAFDHRYIASAQSALTLNVGEERKLIFSIGRKF